MSPKEQPQNSSKPQSKEKPKFLDLGEMTEDAILRSFDPNFKGLDDGG
jgi:hypothetical protein